MSSSYFALIDCNNFYVSCERLFNPKLLGIPVVVLSNNEGCIVARSEEAKSLGIPMGAPYFEWKELLLRQRGVALSANFGLYGDMSRRVMATLSHFHPTYEIYSIDEAFIDFSDIKNPLDVAHDLRKIILQWTGIPVSVGLGKTKTLAKVANKKAKKDKLGVYGLFSDEEIVSILKEMATDDLWGIGRRSARYLKSKGIHTALQFMRQDILWIQKHLSTPAVRVALELRGESCFELEEASAPKKSILTSRSFKEPIFEKEDLRRELSSFVCRAAEKLRDEHQLAHVMLLFIMTSPHRIGPQYSNEIQCLLPEPTNFTPLLLDAAHKSFEKIFKTGFAYKRAGVLLGGLSEVSEVIGDLFQAKDPKQREKEAALMAVFDEVNSRFSDALHFGSERKVSEKEMRARVTSPAFTTSFNELLTIRI